MTGLLDTLLSLGGLSEHLLRPAALVLTRMSLLVFFMPGLGTRAVPVRVKMGLAFCMTALLIPAVPLSQEGDLVPLLAGEAMIGAYLGFSLRISIYALSIAGTIIAQALSLSQIFGAGISEDSSTTVSTLLTMGGAVLFVTANMHVAGYGLLLDSYHAMPSGEAMRFSAFTAERALRMAASGFAFGLSLATPFVLMNLAYNVLLGLLNRAMPQLMVTFVGMPAVTFAGLALLAAASGLILTVWVGYTESLFGAILP